MVKKREPKPSKQKELAKSRIKRLFELAETAFDKDKSRANRYVSLAHKISLKYKTIIPPKLRKQRCKNCGSFLRVGVNCRVRNTNSKMVYTCLECKNHMRFPIRIKKKE